MNLSTKKALVVAGVVVVAAAVVGAIVWSSRPNAAPPENAAPSAAVASSSVSAQATTTGGSAVVPAAVTAPAAATSTAWQTYTSKTAQITFGYPPGWSLGPNTPISIDNFGHRYQGDSIIPVGGAEIDIVSTKYYGLLGDLITTETMSGMVNGTSTVSVDKTACTEVSYSSSYAPGYPSNNVAVYCPYAGNGSLYKIYLSYRAGDPDGARDRAVFGQFLGMVTFLQ